MHLLLTAINHPNCTLQDLELRGDTSPPSILVLHLSPFPFLSFFISLSDNKCDRSLSLSISQQVTSNHLSRVSGSMQPSQPRVYVMGQDFTGKTTVVMALEDGTLNNSHKARPEHKAHRHDATPGVNVSELALDKPQQSVTQEEKKELVWVWDFAGHSEYHMTHGMLLNGDGVHLVMCDLSCADEAVRSDMVMNWLRLIKCRFSSNTCITVPPTTSTITPTPTTEDTRPIVVVCGSNRDSVQDRHVAHQVEDGRWVSPWGNRLVDDARSLFKDHLNIVPASNMQHVDYGGEKQHQQQQEQHLMHVLDCRIGSLWSLETDLLRQALGSCRRMVIERVKEVPGICEWVIKAMPRIRQASKYPIVTIEVFHRLVVDYTDFSQLENQVKAKINPLFSFEKQMHSSIILSLLRLVIDACDLHITDTHCCSTQIPGLDGSGDQCGHT